MSCIKATFTNFQQARFHESYIKVTQSTAQHHTLRTKDRLNHKGSFLKKVYQFFFSVLTLILTSRCVQRSFRQTDDSSLSRILIPSSKRDFKEVHFHHHGMCNESWLFNAFQKKTSHTALVCMRICIAQGCYTTAVSSRSFLELRNFWGEFIFTYMTASNSMVSLITIRLIFLTKYLL